MHNYINSFKNRILSKIILLILITLQFLNVLDNQIFTILSVIDILVVDELILYLREAIFESIDEATKELNNTKRK